MGGQEPAMPMGIESRLDNINNWRIEDLCTRCQKLEIHRLEWSSQTRTRWLGSASKWFSEETCMLCRFLLRSARRMPRYDENNSLWLTPYLTQNILFSDPVKVPIPIGQLIGWRIWMGKGKSSKPELHKPKTWFLPEYTANAPPLRAPLGGSRINEHSANFKQIRKWLTYCMGHHHGICRKAPIMPIPGLLVIDCHTRLIVPAPRDCGFAALSYVWGGPPSDEPSDAKNMLPEKCPKVIEDALTVAKSLDIPYLWIDRYCIDQENPDSKHDLIRNMHLIYQGARVTLIDAAGDDPYHGLAGVNGTPREPQPSTSMGNQTWVVIPDPEQDIAQSRWSTRGWTYQEGMLSRRRLFFTKTQVYFQCKGMHCLESLSADLKYYHRASTDGTTSRGSGFSNAVDGLRALPYDGSRPMFYDILARLREYLERELSYDSDALNAFLGILESFRTYEAYNDLYWDNSHTGTDHSKDERTALHHIWGVFYRKHTTLTTNRHNSDRRPNGFLWSLLWKPSMDTRLTDLSERTGFPSWSWTHWKGLRGLTTLWQEEDQANADVIDEMDVEPQIYIKGSSDELITVEGYEAMIGNAKLPLYLAPALELTAFIAAMKLRWTPMSPFQLSQSLQLLQPTMRLQLEHNRQIVPGAEAEILVDLVKNSSHDYHLLSQDCFVVLLVRFLGYKGLVLQKVEEGVFKRIGTMDWHIMDDDVSQVENSQLKVSLEKTPASLKSTIVDFRRESFTLV